MWHLRIRSLFLFVFCKLLCSPGVRYIVIMLQLLFAVQHGKAQNTGLFIRREVKSIFSAVSQKLPFVFCLLFQPMWAVKHFNWAEHMMIKIEVKGLSSDTKNWVCFTAVPHRHSSFILVFSIRHVSLPNEVQTNLEIIDLCSICIKKNISILIILLVIVM